MIQLAVVVPFVAGLLLRKRFREPLKTSRRLVRINIAGLEPLIVLWCVWDLDVRAGLLILPCAGLALALFMPRVGTNDSQHTFSANDLAVSADLLD